MMIFRKKTDVLAPDEELISQQYIHWWIFILPMTIFIIGFYLWIVAMAKGSFSVASLMILPKEGPSFIPNEIYKYLFIGSEYLIEHIPQPAYEFLNGIRLHPRKWLSQIVIIYAIYRAVRASLTFFTTSVLITNERILVTTGFFKPQSIELPRRHIDAFHVKRSFFSQFFDVGTLIIQASGGLTAKIPSIKTPTSLHTLLIETKKV